MPDHVGSFDKECLGLGRIDPLVVFRCSIKTIDNVGTGHERLHHKRAFVQRLQLAHSRPMPMMPLC